MISKFRHVAHVHRIAILDDYILFYDFPILQPKKNIHGKLCNKKHDFQQSTTNFISLKIPNHIPVIMVARTPKPSAPASIGARPSRNAIFGDQREARLPSLCCNCNVVQRTHQEPLIYTGARCIYVVL
jgi:hypothetical protein